MKEVSRNRLVKSIYTRVGGITYKREKPVTRSLGGGIQILYRRNTPPRS